MKTNICLAFGMTFAGAVIALAQAPASPAVGAPGESPGSIVMGPGGYWQKGDAVQGRGGGAAAGRGRGGGRAGRGGASLSTRPTDTRRTRTAVTGLLGWNVGAPAGAFQTLTFSDAAGKVDALGLSAIEGSSAQKVSPEIQKNLDYNLSADEIAKVKDRLGELRLRMTAYKAVTFPADAASRKKVFEFAKSLGAETIIVGSEAATPADLDQLATDAGVNVALEGISPKNVESALQGRSKKVGVVVDLGKWMEAGVKPITALPLVKDRIMVVNILDRSASGSKGRPVTLGTGTADVAKFLLELSRLDPPTTPPWPPLCGNCGGPRVPVGKPLFLAIDTTGSADTFADLKLSADAFETAIRPAMGYRVDEIARKTPISSPSFVHPDDRAKIEAALPKQAVVKPLKPRKLLVIDITPNSYYHATCAVANLALELMAKNTGAFQPVFSNDLDNLKYPKIRQFDAVFLNGLGGGEVFVDPDVLNGLMRFVREGGGLAGLHGSTYASMDLPEYGEMMGAQDGNHRCCETSTVKIDDPKSPITKAFGGKEFTWYDEFYHFPDTGPFSREKVHVLLSVDAAKTDLTEWKGVRADSEYVSSWIKSYGKGRVFNCALGHTPTLFETPAFGEYMLSAIQFVLGDLKADTTPTGKLAAVK